MKDIKLAAIIDGEVYELVEYTCCSDCAFKDYNKCDSQCSEIDGLMFDEFKHYMLKKVEETEGGKP